MLQGNKVWFDFAAALTTTCSAARLATSLGIVPRATAEVEEAAMEVEVEDTVEEGTEEVQAVEEAEVCFSSFLGEARSLSLSALRLFDTNPPFCLGQTCYSCGGYGHMSRDCTQGQKCYNCMSHPLLEASSKSD